MSAQGQVQFPGQGVGKQASDREPNPHRDVLENLEQLAANFGQVTITRYRQNNGDEVSVRAGNITTHGYNLFNAARQRVDIAATMVTQGIGAGEGDTGASDAGAKAVGAQAMSGMTPRRVP